MRSEARSLLWQAPDLKRYMDTVEDLVLCKVHAVCFGATSSKLYDMRGTWPGLTLLGRLDDKLIKVTKGRKIKKLTKQQGKYLSCVTCSVCRFSFHGIWLQCSSYLLQSCSSFFVLLRGCLCRWVSGDLDALGRSAAYPPALGPAVACCYEYLNPREIMPLEDANIKLFFKNTVDLVVLNLPDVGEEPWTDSRICRNVLSYSQSLCRPSSMLPS